MTFGGEEYIGLPGALHAAGAESVLSTLWPVEDYVATLLIEEFYRLHFAERLDCFPAFCGARQKLREHTADATIGDVRRRLSEPDVTEEIAGHLANIEAFVRRKYAPEDHPFDHPNCWAPYVLSGHPDGRQAKVVVVHILESWQEFLPVPQNFDRPREQCYPEPGAGRLRPGSGAQIVPRLRACPVNARSLDQFYGPLMSMDPPYVPDRK
jgi:hypothetical protein